MAFFKKLPLHIDVNPLRAALKKNADLFGEIDWRRREGSPHTEMRDIWLRYNDIKPYEKTGDFTNFNEEHDPIWYNSYKRLPEAKDIIFKVMNKVYGERLGMVLITKLPVGGKIYPHIDQGWHASYYDKYYIPITNKPGASFFFENGVIESPKEGSVWWFDNSHPHWVNNDSASERIAMIVCIKTENKVGV
ncbi:MAG: aspartyl/asparaginyl beta-hydroxylase domain-containing protein [Thiohalomonadales bacterium]